MLHQLGSYIQPSVIFGNHTTRLCRYGPKIALKYTKVEKISDNPINLQCLFYFLRHFYQSMDLKTAVYIEDVDALMQLTHQFNEPSTLSP